MDVAAILAGLIPLAYLLGSIPFGLIVGLARGVDPRKAGSGNIGATNVARLLGGKYFAIVFTLDLLKGLVPVGVASFVAHGREQTVTVYLLWIGVGLAAILGHMFSIFLKFKGGKGVATSAGVILGLYPFYTVAALIAVAVWGVLFKLFRYVSLASIGGSIMFPIAYAILGLIRGWPILGQQWPLLVFGTLIALLIVWKHRANIRRLLAGQELRAGLNRQAR